ncbi:MAG: oxidoreductase [Planctomycetota bacterium]|nr:MAG: oxidoreductase [Planctomycetota bacterium]
MPRSARLLPLLPVALGAGLWFAPLPSGLSEQAWHLFALFAATIFAVVINALPILLASLSGLALSVVTGTLPPPVAYAGFGEGFVLLIVVAFLAGRAVVSSGLGLRIAHVLVALFGRSTLGLGYAMLATDVLIAPAFPSNTARSGVLYPIVYALAESNGSHPEGVTRRRLGAFLMLNSMAGIGLSSAFWLTAMAANTVGVALVGERGLEITFLSWLVASSVPCLVAMVVVPWLLYRLFPPELTRTPEAPARARQTLSEMGPMSRHEWITAVTFSAMVGGWALGGPLGVDPTAVAMLGLCALMLGGVFTLSDLRKSGAALETLLWFGALFTMSRALDQLGFMAYVGEHLGVAVQGLSWPVTYVVVLLMYVALHYVFVSQTAHLLALFPVMLGVATPVVPAPLMAFSLLFATNYFSVLTPQGSSANVLFAGSGYLTTGEMYRFGGLVTLVNLLIFLGVGTPWLMFVTG